MLAKVKVATLEWEQRVLMAANSTLISQFQQMGAAGCALSLVRNYRCLAAAASAPQDRILWQAQAEAWWACYLSATATQNLNYNSK